MCNSAPFWTRQAENRGNTRRARTSRGRDRSRRARMPCRGPRRRRQPARTPRLQRSECWRPSAARPPATARCCPLPRVVAIDTTNVSGRKRDAHSRTAGNAALGADRAREIVSADDLKSSEVNTKQNSLQCSRLGESSRRHSINICVVAPTMKTICSQMTGVTAERADQQTRSLSLVSAQPKGG